MAILVLVIAFPVLLLGAEVFTNGVEWLGRRLNLGEGVVGSVLAAVGTALPETLVPLVAILLGGESAHDVGIGAIIGAPFMLSTLAMLVTGIAALVFWRSGRRERRLHLNERIISRDLGFFLISFTIALAASYLPTRETRWAAGLAVGLLYVWYLRLVFRADEGTEGVAPPPLYFGRRIAEPGFPRIWLQVIAGLVAIVGGAKLFVSGVEALSAAWNVPPLVFALIAAPIATELPEKFNSVVWIRSGKDTLALGNITGAMVFQSTFPVSIGLLLTDWKLDRYAHLSGWTAVVSAAILLATIRAKGRAPVRVLLLCGALYFPFIGYVLYNALAR
jgi:cation:H+ antiporter